MAVVETWMEVRRLAFSYVGGGGDNGDIELSLPVIIVYDWGRLLNHDDNVGL